MKRVVSLALVLILALSLVGCGKTEAAQKVDDMIADLGEITLNKGTVIEEAQAAVDALEPKEKKSLDNLDVLEEAKATYEGLRQEQVTKVEDAIRALGTVSLGSETAVAAARAAYKALDKDLQERVSNYADLESAESALLDLKAEVVTKQIDAIGEIGLDSTETLQAVREAFDALAPEVQERVRNIGDLTAAEKTLSDLKVENVDALIAAIGKVSLESEETIQTARSAMNGLTTEEAERVTGAETLSEAEAEWKELKKAADEKARAALIRKMKVSEDKVQGITWYEPGTMPQYTNTRCYAYAYIGAKANYHWLRMRFLYTEDSWIFWTKLTIMVDGTRYYRTYTRNQLVRDNAYGDVWEYIDVDPTESDRELLQAIANSKETIIRFEGDTYYYDYTVRPEDKQGIRDALALYDLL